MERLDRFHISNLTAQKNAQANQDMAKWNPCLQGSYHFQISTDSEHSIQTPKYRQCLFTFSINSLAFSPAVPSPFPGILVSIF